MTSTERTAWLKERRNGLGATDIACIAGVGFRDARDIYLDKIGETPLERPVPPLLRMGLITEPLNVELYAERHGIDPRELFPVGLQWSKTAPWAFSTFDRVHKPDGPASRVVETKYTAYFGDQWGEDGSDLVPDGYTIQANWQNATLVSQGETCNIPHISAIDARANLRVYPIVFNPRLVELLLELGEVFWNRVKNRDEVGPDWNHPLRERVLSEAVSIRADTRFRLEDPEALALVEEWDRLAELKKRGEEAEERIKSLKTLLRTHLGDHARGDLPDGSYVRQWPVKGGVVTPAPYEREPRVEVRKYPAKKGKV